MKMLERSYLLQIWLLFLIFNCRYYKLGRIEYPCTYVFCARVYFCSLDFYVFLSQSTYSKMLIPGARLSSKKAELILSPIASVDSTSFLILF